MRAEIALARVHSVIPTRHLANLLTVLRLLLTIPIVLLILTQPSTAYGVATLLFAIAGLTDLLDGYAARRCGTVSTLGTFLDPLADKLVVDGSILALALRAAFPLALAAVLVGRDIAVTGMRLRRRANWDSLSPGITAKLKTVCLYAGITGLLLGPRGGTGVRLGSWALVGLATVLSFLSLHEYLLKAGYRIRLSPTLLGYLLLPRPGPLLSAGKIAFFLLGSFVALSVGRQVAPFRTWLLALFLYEFVVSQGKYLFNDVAGRFSDAYFLRGRSNRCPKRAPGLVALLLYAVARAGLGIGALWLLIGWPAALAGLFSVLLQILYDCFKLGPLPGRGYWSFGAVSANYGVRALAGMAAVSGSAAVSGAGLLVFGWAATLGALFVSIYWQRQAVYYLVQHPTSPVLLARHKPGVLALYRRSRLATRSGSVPLSHGLVATASIGAMLFFSLGTLSAEPVFAASAVAYLSLSLAGLVSLRSGTPARVTRLTLSLAAMILIGGGTAIAALSLRAPGLLPAPLIAIGFLTYWLISSPVTEALMVHGATNGDPATA